MGFCSGLCRCERSEAISVGCARVLSLRAERSNLGRKDYLFVVMVVEQGQVFWFLLKEGYLVQALQVRIGCDKL